MSSLRVLIIPLLTPLPGLILITVVDLVPLRPIAEGIRANHLFFVRAFVSFWIATVMTYVQFKHIVKSMPLSTVQTVGISGIIAVLTVCVMYLLALNVGFRCHSAVSWYRPFGCRSWSSLSVHG